MDDKKYGGDRFTSAFELFALALFTADGAAVPELLPSGDLRPLH